VKGIQAIGEADEQGFFKKWNQERLLEVYKRRFLEVTNLQH